MRIGANDEIRLSSRAALTLFLAPHLCAVAALFALILVGRDGAAPPLLERHAAHAESLPGRPLPPPLQAEPITEIPKTLAASAYPVTQGIEHIPAYPQNPRLVQSMLDRIISFAETSGRPDATPIAERMAREISPAMEEIQSLLPDRPMDDTFEDRLAPINNLLETASDLQSQFSGGAKPRNPGSSEGLAQLQASLAQLLPLLNALQQFRQDGGANLRREPVLATSLDSFLGRDAERPHRLAVLLLVARMLEDASGT